jgi:hypothetical protein
MRPKLTAPLHFLHHNRIVSQHQFAESGELFRPQARKQSGKSRVQGGNTGWEAETPAQKAIQHFPRLTLIHFHYG